MKIHLTAKIDSQTFQASIFWIQFNFKFVLHYQLNYIRLNSFSHETHFSCSITKLRLYCYSCFNLVLFISTPQRILEINIQRLLYVSCVYYTTIHKALPNFKYNLAEVALDTSPLHIKGNSLFRKVPVLKSGTFAQPE